MNIEKQLKSMAYLSAVGRVLVLDNDEINEESPKFKNWYNGKAKKTPEGISPWEPFEGYEDKWLIEQIKSEEVSLMGDYKHVKDVVEANLKEKIRKLAAVDNAMVSWSMLEKLFENTKETA